MILEEDLCPKHVRYAESIPQRAIRFPMPITKIKGFSCQIFGPSKQKSMETPRKQKFA
jgi:hypothetical protein